MVSQATEIRDIIEAGWALTGRLSKTPLDNMKEIVRFFDRVQVKGNEWPKAVVVEKVNDQQDEGRDIHPKYDVFKDTYQITMYYRIVDVQEDSYSNGLEDVEEMARETQRILRTEFNPASGAGPFFVTRSFWRKEDYLESAQPELRRRLFYELTKFESQEDEVFKGFGGILLFDTSDSEGEDPPAQDYTYTEVTNVNIDEGYPQIPFLTKDKTLGLGVPQLARGMWSGIFTADTYAKASDFDGSTTDKLDNIYKTQASSPLIGQIPEVVFLHANTNNESTPRTLTTKSFVKIDRMVKNAPVENLVTYQFRGRLSRPTEFTVA